MKRLLYHGHEYRAVLRCAEFPAETYDAIVYHGSREPDLAQLEGGAPPYKGGLGAGVYVDFDRDVAAFYGPYVYKLKLKLRPEEVFVLDPNVIPGMEGHSILVGETVAPFWFEIGNDKFAVTEGMDFSLPLDYRRGFLTKLKALLTTPDKWQTYFLVMPFDQELSAFLWKLCSELKVDEWDEVTEDAVPRFDSISEYISDDLWEKLELRYSLDRDRLSDDLDSGFIAFFTEHLNKFDYGLEIDLDDIGAEVEAHGYKAVYVEGIRPMSELLVFNADDLEMIGLDIAVA